MNRARRNPLVYAGLFGVALTQVPRNANALELFGHAVPDGLIDGVAPFVGGCGVALVAAGVVARVVSRRRAKLRQAEAPEPAQGEKRPVAASVHKPRHVRADEWETSNTIRVQDVEEALGATTAPARRAKGSQGAQAKGDYGDIAQEYVSNMTFTERMSNRARGVAALLTERLSTDMMAGVPVIERADGSVGDVGTAWWDKAMEESNVARGFDLWILGTEDTMANKAKTVDADLAKGETVVATAEQVADAASVASPLMQRLTSQELSLLIPQIDEGVFPEVREVASPDKDSFELALEALGEDFSVAPIVVFQDVVGGEDSLDEPDDIEGPTEFIKFRVPGGHPEVVDTGTYIDYLLSEEMANNSSSAVRRRAPQRRAAHIRRMAPQSTLETHQYLTLHEGGAKPVGKHFARKPEAAAEEYKPKHMARPAEPLAMEA